MQDSDERRTSTSALEEAQSSFMQSMEELLELARVMPVFNGAMYTHYAVTYRDSLDVPEDVDEDFKRIAVEAAEFFMKAVSEEGDKTFTVPDSPGAPFFVEAMEKIVSLPPSHTQTLGSAVVVAAVTQLELLLGECMRAFFYRFPDALGESQDKLTLGELLECASIDEARSLLVTRRIDALMFSGLANWLKVIDKKVGVDLGWNRKVVAAVQEIVLRRHLIVHTGGKVSEAYLRDVAWRDLGIDPPGPEARIHHSVATLEWVIDNIEVLGLVVIQEFWARIAKDSVLARTGDVKEPHSFSGAVWRAMSDSRWGVVEKLCSWASNDSQTSEEYRSMAKFHFWLALKRQGSVWDDARKEITELDCSAMHPKFALMQAVLLDDLDQSFDLLPRCGLTPDEVHTWPVLEELRTDPRYAWKDTRPPTS